MINAYPLHWPEGWERTKPEDRKPGRFSKAGRSEHGWRTSNAVTISQALNRIHNELQTFDGTGRRWSRIDPDQTVISTNLKVRRSDGLPASSQRNPDDPGAAVYFELDGKRQVVPCDMYTDVAQNLAGVAASISALRALERHGSGIMERAFRGFVAIEHNNENGLNWWDVLEVRRDATRHEIELAYRKLRSKHHPDKPEGNEGRFIQVTEAYNVAVSP